MAQNSFGAPKGVSDQPGSNGRPKDDPILTIAHQGVNLQSFALPTELWSAYAPSDASTEHVCSVMVHSTCIVPTEALQQPVKVLGCPRPCQAVTYGCRCQDAALQLPPQGASTRSLNACSAELHMHVLGCPGQAYNGPAMDLPMPRHASVHAHDAAVDAKWSWVH